jgi:hypothetical protein
MASLQRRTMPIGHVILVGAICFGVGALLNVDSLESIARRQPFGTRRDVAITLLSPLRWTSHQLRLDRPRQRADRALGRTPPTTFRVPPSSATDGRAAGLTPPARP